jgi:hypothetical protein
MMLYLNNLTQKLVSANDVNLVLDNTIVMSKNAEMFIKSRKIIF